MHRAAGLAALALPPIAAPAGAATPAQTLHLLVPYPAGGAVDYLARLLAEPLRAQLQRPVVVENVAGAAGAIGLQKLLEGPADGHAIAIGTDSDLILAPLVNPDIRYSSADFSFLGTVNVAPMVLVAGPRTGTQPLAALLGPRAEPLAFANYGMGSNAHLLALKLAQRARIEALHVPYRGIAPLLQDLLSGQVDVAFLPLGGSLPDMLAAGKLRCVGVAAAQRHPLLAGVPTFDEAGYGPFVHLSWGGVLMPRGAPTAVVAELHRGVQRAIEDPHLRAQLAATGGTASAPMSLAQADRFVQAELARYRLLQGSGR